jgi:hypothetical protein
VFKGQQERLGHKVQLGLKALKVTKAIKAIQVTPEPQGHRARLAHKD